jgi:DNA-binding PadR family transcriptional regulator
LSSFACPGDFALARNIQPACPDRIRLRHLQPLCLALLARRPGSGYDVMAGLSALPMFQASPPDAPGVYRTLQAFEKGGLLRGRRQPSKKGPTRCEYTLTPAGRVSLAGWQKTLLGAREELDAVMALLRQARKGANRAAGQRSYTPAIRREERDVPSAIRREERDVPSAVRREERDVPSAVRREERDVPPAIRREERRSAAPQRDSTPAARREECRSAAPQRDSSARSKVR